MISSFTNSKKILNNSIYILSNFFCGLFINFIGSISITELFVLTRIPRILRLVTKTRIPELKKISILFVLLLCAQIIAELCIGNDFINALKGIMVTIMSFLLFIFYLDLLLNNISVVKWTPLAIVASIIVFGDQFGFAEQGEETYLKFYVAPILINSVLFIFLSGGKWVSKNIIPISTLTSLFVIANGARSTGFSLLFTTLAYFIYIYFKTISWRKTLPVIIIVAITFQFFYAYVYIPKVVSGEWGSDQNREQLARVDNSRNALMMILAARSDFFVSWEAFMDKPIWGHGAWAQDENFKYQKKLLKLQGEEMKEGLLTDNLIPVHSVIVGMGTQHGILKFMIFCILIIYIYRLGIKGLNRRLPKGYIFYLLYMYIISFQSLMFGPPAVLKSMGSIAFAIFVAFYLLNKRFNEKKIQTSHHYRNI